MSVLVIDVLHLVDVGNHEDGFCFRTAEFIKVGNDDLLVSHSVIETCKFIPDGDLRKDFVKGLEPDILMSSL